MKHNDTQIRALWSLYAAATMRNPGLLDGFPKLSDSDWARIYAIATANQLNALVVDALSMLPADVQPSPKLRRSWVAPLVNEIKRHADNNLVIADLFSRWHAVGLKPVLLKGQSYARFYPDPTVRVIGDIDVFIDPSAWDAALEVVRSLPLDTPEMPEIEKHIEFFYRKKCVELHRYAAEDHHNPAIDAEMQAWGNAQMNGSTETFRIDPSGNFVPGETVVAQLTQPQSDKAAADSVEKTDGLIAADSVEKIVTVAVPTVTFDAFFILQHFWEHIEIGMPKTRSLADFAIFLRANRDRIDYPLLEEKLRRFNLLEKWQVAGDLLVQRFGLDPAAFPFYNPKMDGKAKALGELLDRYFAHAEDCGKPMGRIARKVNNFAFYLTLYPLRFRLFPARQVVNNFFRVLYLGLHNLFPHKTP